MVHPPLAANAWEMNQIGFRWNHRGLWLRGALSGDPFDTKAALRLANDYIDLLLAQSGS